MKKKITFLALLLLSLVIIITAYGVLADVKKPDDDNLRIKDISINTNEDLYFEFGYNIKQYVYIELIKWDEDFLRIDDNGLKAIGNITYYSEKNTVKLFDNNIHTAKVNIEPFVNIYNQNKEDNKKNIINIYIPEETTVIYDDNNWRVKGIKEK